MPQQPSSPFRDREQAARVCRTLLARVGLERHGSLAGPSPEARRAPPSGANSDAGRLLEACWTLWERTSTLSLDQLLRLAPAHLEALGELIAALALGAEAIDGWVERADRETAGSLPGLRSASARRR